MLYLGLALGGVKRMSLFFMSECYARRYRVNRGSLYSLELCR